MASVKLDPVPPKSELKSGFGGTGGGMVLVKLASVPNSQDLSTVLWDLSTGLLVTNGGASPLKLLSVPQYLSLNLYPFSNGSGGGGYIKVGLFGFCQS